MHGGSHRPNRRSIRLSGHSYSQDGAYFVTVVTRERMTLFGDVIDGDMRLNDTGRMISQLWEWLETRYPYVRLDEYVVMPNHLHGVIVLGDLDAGGSRTAPTGVVNGNRVDTARRKPLGRLVGAFKTVTTKQANLAKGTPGQVLWQRNFYERIIRSDQEWNRIREYIANNPLKWEEDSENPAGTNRRRSPST